MEAQKASTDETQTAELATAEFGMAATIKTGELGDELAFDATAFSVPDAAVVETAIYVDGHTETLTHATTEN